MRAIDPEISGRLTAECNGDPIHYIGLGLCDFQISFNRMRLQSEEKLKFKLGDAEFEWTEGANRIPIWLLIGQIPKAFEVPNRFTLRMLMTAGDAVDFITVESPYESLIVDYGERNGKLVMEIF